MKTTTLKILGLTLVGVLTVSNSFAQKTIKFSVDREIDLPADKVWEVIGIDYGSIAYSHPKIIRSEYLKGTLKAREGAERVCYFNDKGTQYLKEKIVGYDPANMTFVNQVFQAGKFPLNPDVTRGTYKLTDLGNGKTKMSFTMEYRTKPAMMGAMAKGKFKKLINDYMISIEHYGKTGEKVTKENFKDIKKNYS